MWSCRDLFTAVKASCQYAAKYPCAMLFAGADLILIAVMADLVHDSAKVWQDSPCVEVYGDIQACSMVANGTRVVGSDCRAMEQEYCTEAVTLSAIGLLHVFAFFCFCCCSEAQSMRARWQDMLSSSAIGSSSCNYGLMPRSTSHKRHGRFEYEGDGEGSASSYQLQQSESKLRYDVTHTQSAIVGGAACYSSVSDGAGGCGDVGLLSPTSFHKISP